MSPTLRHTTPTKQLTKLWIGVNVVGFAIATPLSLLMTLTEDYLQALYTAGLIIGSIVGPLQAWVLKHQLPRLRTWQWTLANIVGSYLGSWAGLFMVGSIAMMFRSFNSFTGLDGITALLLTLGIYGAVIGIFVGVAQIFSLPSQAQNVRQWWTANFTGRSLGWLSAGLSGWFLSEAIPNLDEPFSLMLGAPLGAIGGAVYALATAKAMLKLNSTTL
ncbi:MAG: hypothetical protein AAGA83_23785 [Cyanobacteria bacterium P01_F01_bin.116]